MWQAGTVLFWDTKKDERFFLKLEPGDGFGFTVHEPFLLEEAEERVNQKLEHERFFVRITKSLLEKGEYEVRCFHFLMNPF